MNMNPIANSLAAQGRGGDSMLVHMTPGEVGGLQALARANGGSLSINPNTGLPEANILKRLLPMVVGAALGPAGVGLSAMQAGLVVGGLGAAATGNVGKGLMMGLTAGTGASLAGGIANAATSGASPLTSAAELGAGPQIPSPTPDMAPNPGVDFTTQTPFSVSKPINTPLLEAAQSNIDPGALENMSAADVANARVLPGTPAAPAMSPTDRLASGFSNITSSSDAAMQFVKENPYSLAGAATLLASREPEGPPSSADYIAPYELDITNTSGSSYPRSSAEREQLKYRFRALPTYKVAKGGAIGYAEGGATGESSAIPPAPSNMLSSGVMYTPSVSAPAPTPWSPAPISAGLADVYQNIARTQQMAGLPALNMTGFNVAPRPAALKPMTFEQKQDALASRRMTDMFQNVLGRAPTDAELGQYKTRFGTSADPFELRQFRNEMENAGYNTMSSFSAPGMSDVDVRSYIEANPGLSDAAYATWMRQHGVSPEQMSDITGLTSQEVTDRYNAGISSGGGAMTEISPGNTVENMFTSMLGREGTADELAKWKGIVGSEISPKEIKQFRKEYKKLGQHIYNKKPEGYVKPSATTTSVPGFSTPNPEGYVDYVFNPSTGTYSTPVANTAGTTFSAPTIPGYTYNSATNQYEPINFGGGSASGGLIAAKRYNEGGDIRKKRPKDPYDFADFRDSKAMSKAAEQFNVGGLAGLNAFAKGRFLNGPGDGVSDSIPAMIGNQQPARLADGEFVIDARTVSEIGNGSSKAGAQKLYAMMDRVHNARKKAKRGQDTKAEKYLPA